MKDILGFRLRSGEDLIAAIESVNEDEYVVYRPVVPINQNQPGQQAQQNGLLMLKWAPFADQDLFTLTKDDYVGRPYKIWKELEDFYLESTSKIALK